MMPLLLTAYPSGEKVFINGDKIQRALTQDRGRGTHVYLETGVFVAVRETPEELAALIESKKGG